MSYQTSSAASKSSQTKLDTVILGIESSCDETAASVVVNGREVLSSIIASQIDIHRATGGVVPEVAAREHVLKIRAVIDDALKQANKDLSDIDAIAVTQGPGLLSSLIVGFTAAATLARIYNKPLIPVHHIAGHIYANWLGLAKEEKINFPVLVLTVSGGHNELVLMNRDTEFLQIGDTLDDAAGEAFDKVARILNLGYPGGPEIYKAALNGDPLAIDFPRALLKKDNFDFSFSGLKTAVLREVQAYHQLNGTLDDTFIADCAASFQHAVCDVLSEKLIRAAIKHQVSEIHIAGGVSANKYLRKMVEDKFSRLPDKVLLRYDRQFKYCTDNAAMIAGAGYYFFQQNRNSFFSKIEQYSEDVVIPDPQLDLYNI